MNIGKNISLSPAEVESALREHARQKAAAAGEKVPDALDFVLTGKLHYLGPDSQPLVAPPFSAVVVTF
jgi:hypothetical protein